MQSISQKINNNEHSDEEVKKAIKIRNKFLLDIEAEVYKLTCSLIEFKFLNFEGSLESKEYSKSVGFLMHFVKKRRPEDQKYSTKKLQTTQFVFRSSKRSNNDVKICHQITPWNSVLIE